MASAGNITAAEAEKAGKHLPDFPEIPAQSKYAGQKGHMLTMVRNELHGLGFDDEQIDGGGLRITTTFTRKAMAAAANGVRESVPTWARATRTSTSRSPASSPAPDPCVASTAARTTSSRRSTGR